MTMSPLIPVASDAAAVGIGAVCGALCRHQIGKAASERIARDPKLQYLTGWHTAGINVMGSFILGGVVGSPVVNPNHTQASMNGIKSASSGCSGGMGMTPRMKLMAGVGFCGSFTTFSTFSTDIVSMVGKGEMVKACSYFMVNNVGGVTAAAAGMVLAKKMFGL